jgi:hypothetical protein
MSNWFDEETDYPTHADRRNFYKVEQWSKDGMRVAPLSILFAATYPACWRLSRDLAGKLIGTERSTHLFSFSSNSPLWRRQKWSSRKV